MPCGKLRFLYFQNILMNGWIKLDRDILEGREFQNSNELKFWIWLMLKASTKDRFTPIKTGKGSQTIQVKRGQLIFGRHKAEEELGLDGSMIYRMIKKFESEQVIKVEPNNQYSIITVLDFINSQRFTKKEIEEITESEQPIKEESNSERTSNEQPMSSQRTADEQPTNTVEESLEGKELKESKEGLESSESEDAPPLILTGQIEKPKNGSHKKPRMPAAKKIEVFLPWQTEEFTKAWESWKRYKAGEFKFNYKTVESEQAGLIELSGLSDGDEITAIKIINKAMAKGWKGLFRLKDEDLNPQNKINGNGSYQQPINGRVRDNGASQLLESLKQDVSNYPGRKHDNSAEI